MKKYFFVLLIFSFILSACASSSVRVDNNYVDISDISKDAKKDQILDKEKKITELEIEKLEQDIYEEEAKNFGWIKMSEVEKHNMKTDCWVIIHDKVFNVTKYNDFPDDYTLEGCGIDITENLERNNIYLDSALDEYYLGDLEL